jgi:hypothetical protein
MLKKNPQMIQRIAQISNLAGIVDRYKTQLGDPFLNCLLREANLEQGPALVVL